MTKIWDAGFGVTTEHTLSEVTEIIFKYNLLLYYTHREMIRFNTKYGQLGQHKVSQLKKMQLTATATLPTTLSRPPIKFVIFGTRLATNEPIRQNVARLALWQAKNQRLACGPLFESFCPSGQILGQGRVCRAAHDVLMFKRGKPGTHSPNFLVCPYSVSSCFCF